MDFKEIKDLYNKADFDKDRSCENRVFAKINKNKKVFPKIWLLAPAAAIIAALFFIPKTDKKITAYPAQTNLSSEECAELSARNWLEQAAKQSKTVLAKCHNGNFNSFNNDFILRISEQFEKTGKKLSREEKEKLNNCEEQFKQTAQPVILFDVKC